MTGSGRRSSGELLLVALAIVAGAFLLGRELHHGLLEFKDRERAVTVKGLAEPEVTGDVGLRYSATRTVTVYSEQVDLVRSTMSRLDELGRKGIVFDTEDYQARPQFLFTKLNDLKPEMIEEATRNAREVARKFAEDSDSSVGRIRRASQGQFSIDDRDSSTPHIKKVRVVSTVEYYLAD